MTKLIKKKVKTNLEENVDQIQDLAEDELEDVGAVGAHGPDEIVDELGPLRLELLGAGLEHLAGHVLHQHLDLAALA